MRNKIFIVLLIFLLIPFYSIYASPTPSFSEIPIDGGGLIFLLIAGFGYAIKLFYDNRKKE